jgi:prepilin-type N-terminal cleavage/methylation domain-containing protein
MKKGWRKRAGFTLLEVIITLVLFGIMAAMLGPYLVKSISGSVTPLTNLNNEITLQSALETIVKQYESAKTISNLATIKASLASTTTYTATSKYVAYNSSSKDFSGTVSTNNMLLVTLTSKSSGETLTVLLVGK